MSQPPLHLVPVRSRDAKAFVVAWHRHHPPPAGMVFAVGAADDDGVLHAVATVGRPVARHLDDGQTLEVTRTCTDGIANANSMLYGAASPTPTRCCTGRHGARRRRSATAG
ncbi:XF1762 family protein [Streptomyces sp. NPDC093801]|uniref:XF1762 family protein n=1 Tax=Streptomyces sp. NPDC093801 TaxID=3155203 RepID=UPI00344BE3D3